MVHQPTSGPGLNAGTFKDRKVSRLGKKRLSCSSEVGLLGVGVGDRCSSPGGRAWEGGHGAGREETARRIFSTIRCQVRCNSLGHSTSI